MQGDGVVDPGDATVGARRRDESRSSPMASNLDSADIPPATTIVRPAKDPACWMSPCTLSTVDCLSTLRDFVCSSSVLLSVETSESTPIGLSEPASMIAKCHSDVSMPKTPSQMTTWAVYSYSSVEQACRYIWKKKYTFELART